MYLVFSMFPSCWLRSMCSIKCFCRTFSLPRICWRKTCWRRSRTLGRSSKSLIRHLDDRRGRTEKKTFFAELSSNQVVCHHYFFYFYTWYTFVFITHPHSCAHTRLTCRWSRWRCLSTVLADAESEEGFWEGRGDKKGRKGDWIGPAGPRERTDPRQCSQENTARTILARTYRSVPILRGDAVRVFLQTQNEPPLTAWLCGSDWSTGWQ